MGPKREEIDAESDSAHATAVRSNIDEREKGKEEGAKQKRIDIQSPNVRCGPFGRSLQALLRLWL